MLGRNRKRDRQREQAAGLRQEATAHVADHAKSEAAAREKAADAERARAEAERLEAEAAERQRALDVDRARHEDTLREADRLDPDVDTRHPDYTPGAGATTANESTTTESTTTEPVPRPPTGYAPRPGRPQVGPPRPPIPPPSRPHASPTRPTTSATTPRRIPGPTPPTRHSRGRRARTRARIAPEALRETAAAVTCVGDCRRVVSSLGCAHRTGSSERRWAAQHGGHDPSRRPSEGAPTHGSHVGRPGGRPGRHRPGNRRPRRAQRSRRRRADRAGADRSRRPATGADERSGLRHRTTH